MDATFGKLKNSKVLVSLPFRRTIGKSLTVSQKFDRDVVPFILQGAKLTPGLEIRRER